MALSCIGSAVALAPDALLPPALLPPQAASNTAETATESRVKDLQGLPATIRIRMISPSGRGTRVQAME
jgi:hypothetical protein